MQKIAKNNIDQLKIPNTNILVMHNGVFQAKLSNRCDNLTFTKQNLKIFKNIRLKKPLHLLFINSQSSNCNINIIAEENCNFTLIEEHINYKNFSYNSNVKINITAKKNSKIIYYKLQNEDNNTTHNKQTIIKQEKNSSISSSFVGKGAKVSSDLLHVKLSGKNANYNSIGIIALHQNQIFNYKTNIEHLAPNCTSNVLFKGIINDKAVGNFSCLVVATKNATKTETHVINKNLLLSPLATMNTSPQLEIYVDDLICTHGATVGQLDSDALFYLRSRGLAENMAKQLLTNAFIQEIIGQFAPLLQQKINIDNTYEHQIT